MKTALIALILGLGVAAQGPAQSIWSQRSAPCRSAPGLVWTTGGFSWRFASAPVRVWRPVGWSSPCWWRPGAVVVGRPWTAGGVRRFSSPAWSPSHPIVPDPVVIPSVSLLTETGAHDTP